MTMMMMTTKMLKRFLVSHSTSTHDLLSTHLLNFPLFFFLPLPASSHHSFNSGLPTSAFLFHAFLFSSFFVFSLSFLLQTPSFPLFKYSHLPSYFILFQLPLSIPHFLTPQIFLTTPPSYHHSASACRQQWPVQLVPVAAGLPADADAQATPKGHVRIHRSVGGG